MAELDVLQIKVEDVDVSQVPELIQGKFAKMSELKNQIERASNKAFDAKEAVIDEVGAKRLPRKEEIEKLQTATLVLANAQESAMNAQKLQFDYQQQLGEITKFLFRLGITNIAMNRAVVAELEYKLRNASQEELDDLARAEIEKLLKRLKMQQDLEQKITELRDRLKEQNDITDSQSSAIKEQAEKDEEHDRRIDELYSIITKQDQVIEKILIEMAEMRKDLFKRDEEIAQIRNEIENRP